MQIKAIQKYYADSLPCMQTLARTPQSFDIIQYMCKVQRVFSKKREKHSPTPSPAHPRQNSNITMGENCVTEVMRILVEVEVEVEVEVKEKL